MFCDMQRLALLLLFPASLAAFLGWSIVRGRVSSFACVITRAKAPSRFWARVAVWGCIDIVWIYIILMQTPLCP
jgi:hypothetical protein